MQASLLFLKDTVAPEDLEGWARVRRALPHTPLAGGERLATKWGTMALMRDGLGDTIQPDIGRAGGITEMKKIAALAETHSTQFAPHSGSLGPVAEFAAAHLMASITKVPTPKQLETEEHGLIYLATRQRRAELLSARETVGTP